MQLILFYRYGNLSVTTWTFEIVSCVEKKVVVIIKKMKLLKNKYENKLLID